MKLPFEELQRDILLRKEAASDHRFGCRPAERPVEQLIQYGIINLNKPSGPSSHQVADYVQRILEITKSGHSGTLDPKAEIFRKRFSPIIILTSERAPKANLKRLGRLATEVKVFPGEEIDFGEALMWLRRKWNVRRLLCEGGGELDSGLLRARIR